MDAEGVVWRERRARGKRQEEGKYKVEKREKGKGREDER